MSKDDLQEIREGVESIHEMAMDLADSCGHLIALVSAMQNEEAA